MENKLHNNIKEYIIIKVLIRIIFMSQRNQVINVMEKNGGYATLGFLYKNVDVSKWGTKTPYASIRRIVQSERYFFKIKPGLWGLEYLKDDILLKFNIGELINNADLIILIILIFKGY